MKSTKYSNRCLKLFGKYFQKYKKDQLEEKNLLFVKANIPMSYEEYYSMAFMNMIIGVISGLIAGVVIHIIFSTPLSLLLAILLPVLVLVLLATTYLTLPTYYIKKRAEDIDLFLPYAINFIGSMAVAGISPADIFQTLSQVEVYGEVQVEAKKIAKDINVMGNDNISALKHAIDTSPSKKFKSFIQGILGTLQSGSDLHMYLSNIAKKYMEEDLIARKNDLEVLAVIAEVMVITVIAFPIFLVIILSVMGFFGGSMSYSLNILLFFSFLILPFIYAGFYYLILSTSIEKITRMKPEKNTSLKKFFKLNRMPIIILLLSFGFIALFYGVILLSNYFKLVNLNFYMQLDFLFLSVFFILGPISFYNYTETKKRRNIQERLPDFLVEVSDSLSSGMDIFEAIKVSEKGHYEHLSPEITKMKVQLSWNVSVQNVFHDFADRMKSAIVQRVVIVIDKALIMGGKTPKIFKAAAGEVDQVNQLEYQRRTNMSIYMMVILMCFFIFLAIIIILDKTIFMTFLDLQVKQMKQPASGLGQVNTLRISPIDPMVLKYSLYSFIFVQSIGAGALAGFMMDGKLSSGIRYSVILGLISFFVFKFMF
jgi:archaeal flagellar protein FlaJ